MPRPLVRAFGLAAVLWVPLMSGREARPASGVIVIEAENFAEQRAAAGLPVAKQIRWVKEAKRPGFGGSGYVTTDPAHVPQGGYKVGASPVLIYDIEVEEAGAYYTSVRGLAWTDGKSTPGSHDSVFITTGGREVTRTSWKGSSFPNRWHWAFSDEDVPAEFTIDLPKGKVRLELWLRESGAVIDQILLLKDKTARPRGDEGPWAIAGPTALHETLAGETAGTILGKGRFVPEGGWSSAGGLIAYDVGRPIRDGYFEATMRGFTVPVKIIGKQSKLHPLNGWEKKEFTMGTTGGYWNLRIGHYKPFKIFAQPPGGKREETPIRWEDLGRVNDGQPHIYGVRWTSGPEGRTEFFFDGEHLGGFHTPEARIQYFTVGNVGLEADRVADPSPIISEVRVVDFEAPQPVNR